MHAMLSKYEMYQVASGGLECPPLQFILEGRAHETKSIYLGSVKISRSLATEFLVAATESPGDMINYNTKTGDTAFLNFS